MSRAQWIEREHIRRMIGDVPSIFAVRNSAVLKSWLFLSNGQLDESCLHVFYRIDAAEAEMVHGKILQTSGPIYKTLKTAILFPTLQEFSAVLLGASVTDDRKVGKKWQQGTEHYAGLEARVPGRLDTPVVPDAGGHICPVGRIALLPWPARI